MAAINKQTKIPPHTIIYTLKRHNAWRRGEETDMINPTYLGNVIDEAVALLEDVFIKKQGSKNRKQKL